MSRQQKHIDLAKHQTLEIKVPAHIVHFHLLICELTCVDMCAGTF